MRAAFAWVAAALAAALLPAMGAFAQGWPGGSPLETLTVPATGATETSSTVLAEGQWYWLLADGTYTQSSAGHLADAEWEQLVLGSEEPDDWRESNPEMPSEHELMINETDVDWMGSALSDPDPVADWASYSDHVFSQNHHTYWYCIQGTGAPVSFRIEDHQYSDNSGELSVSIYQAVPEPTVLALLAPGLLLFLRRRKI